MTVTFPPFGTLLNAFNCVAVNVPVNEGFSASAFKLSCVVVVLLFNVVKTSVVPINNESLIINLDILVDILKSIVATSFQSSLANVP